MRQDVTSTAEGIYVKKKKPTHSRADAGEDDAHLEGKAQELLRDSLTR